MNFAHSTKVQLKNIRWHSRRGLTALRWGYAALKNTPTVLGNAMPKSGSHLIIQVLQGLTHMGPFVNPGFPPVNRSEGNKNLPDQKVLANIERLHPGDIAYGYIHAREPFLSAMIQSGRANVFVYRDPRDMVISHIFYATQMHTGHGMHQYYTQTLQSMEERINAAIQGVEHPGSELSPIQAKYSKYLGWLDQPDVLTLRFEDLILDQQSALSRLLDYLEARGYKPQKRRTQAVEILQKAINPKKSGTFRKGKPGNWRDHFTETNKSLFKKNTGNLLMRLGYEESDNW
jgi:hypothetical protein